MKSGTMYKLNHKKGLDSLCLSVTVGNTRGSHSPGELYSHFSLWQSGNRGLDDCKGM